MSDQLPIYSTLSIRTLEIEKGNKTIQNDLQLVKIHDIVKQSYICKSHSLSILNCWNISLFALQGETYQLSHDGHWFQFQNNEKKLGNFFATHRYDIEQAGVQPHLLYPVK